MSSSKFHSTRGRSPTTDCLYFSISVSSTADALVAMNMSAFSANSVVFRSATSLLSYMELDKPMPRPFSESLNDHSFSEPGQSNHYSVGVPLKRRRWKEPSKQGQDDTCEVPEGNVVFKLQRGLEPEVHRVM